MGCKREVLVKDKLSKKLLSTTIVTLMLMASFFIMPSTVVMAAAPYTPNTELPGNNSIDISINTNISWNCSDPDGDPLTYDVYFGNESPPPKMMDHQMDNQTNTTYYYGILDYNTPYYWRIVAWDNNSENTSGPIWQFTTEQEPGNGTICGYVNSSEDGVFLENATVMINKTSEGTPFFSSVKTNDSGFYIFDSNVSAGTYNVEAYKDGFLSQDIVNNTLYENNTCWVNISLNIDEGGGPDGDMPLTLNRWDSSVTPAHIINNTEREFNLTLISECGDSGNLLNLTVILPENFAYVDNTNGTSVSPSANYTFESDSINRSLFWNATNYSNGFLFGGTENFWFNSTSNASLGSSQFRIIAYTAQNESNQINMTVFTTNSFSFNGSIKDAEGQGLPGAVGSMSVISFGSMDSPMVTLGTFTGISNATGNFTIMEIPTLEENVSNLSGGEHGGPGPGGGSDCLFYQFSAAQYNDSTYTYAINMSSTLPSIPITELFQMLDNPEVYLKPAISFRVKANGSRYSWNETGSHLTYGDKNFSLMAKDQKLGFCVKEFSSMTESTRIFSAPRNRNYSLSIFADQSFPISVRLNNLITTCTDGGNFNISGVTTSCTPYNGTYLIDVTVNTSSIETPITGYFNNITNLSAMWVVTYTMEDQDMVFENWAMPYNLNNMTGEGTNDAYNLSSRTYNVSLPATIAPSYLLLRAYARNDTGYYMGSHIITAENGTLSESTYNFSMSKLIEGVNRTISTNNCSSRWNDTTIVNTTGVLFNLVNSTGAPLDTENAFIEIKRELEGTEYMQMIDASNGQFNLSLTEGASLKKLTIYSQRYAPISTPVSAAILNGSTNTTTVRMDYDNGICNITLMEFGSFDPLEEDMDFMMMMFKSNESCNIPNPPLNYALFSPGEDENGTGKDSFSPFNAILKGDISLLIRCKNISVYYINVDLLASGPPDASFTTSGTESEGGLAAAWKFGSQGPDIYDEVIIGIPYSSNISNATIKVTIPILYDNEYHIIWNASAGDTIDDILNETRDGLAEYKNYVDGTLDSRYAAYLNGTGVICNASDRTLSSGLGYKDTENQTIWIKIPHFSGIGPKVTGLEPNQPSSFTATIFNETQVNLTWIKGADADYTYIECSNTTSSWIRGEGTEIYNDTGTSDESIGLTNGTVYYYQAWSWNTTHNAWSISNASANNIPNTPSSFSASASSTSVIALTWSSGHNADYTYVEWNSTLGPWSRGEGTELDNLTGTSKSHTGLSSNTRYYYQAWSWNSTVGLWSTSNVSCNAKTNEETTGGTQTTTDDTTTENETTETGTTNTTKEEVENLYNISLEQNFSASDTDEDGMSDSFTDPNGILNAQHFVNINGNDTILISVNETLDELFIWDTTADTITQVTHNVGTVTDTTTDIENDSIIITVSVNKSNWIYIEVTDEYPDIPNLAVETSDGRVISSDMVWRENGKIYVLDDPDTTYSFTYQYTILAPTFNPISGTTFDTGKPTITITYTETVTVTEVTLNGESINLTTTDNKTFAYVPGTNLTNGVYTLSITVQDADTNSRTDTATYAIDVELAESQSALPLAMMVAIITAAIAAIAVIVILYKKKIF